MRLRTLTLTLSLTLALAACNREGVGSFAPNSSRVAIVSNDDGLYTSDLSGGGLVKLSDPVIADFGVSLSPFGDTIVYVRQDSFGVYTQPAGGGTPGQIFAPPTPPSQGIVTFIPSGEVLIIFQDDAGGYELNVVPSTGGVPRVTISGISQVFVPQAVVRPRRGTNGSEFILRPYGLGQINLVLVIGTELRLYTASAAGLFGPVVLPRAVDPALVSLLALRPVDDVTSGLLSADGRRLILRTQDNAGHNLFAVNLDENSDAVTLVSGASAQPAYSFPPSGHQVVYEADGALFLYDFDTGNSSRLVDEGTSPGWW